MAPAARGMGGRPDEADDICPVCKSSRYLNPKMKFLINPECYHRMCESCVDRIFSQGPAPCPVAGCGRTLRKARFKKQTFGDIQIERECDIRRRLAAVFNHHEEDFDNLRAFNDYEEWKENLAQNLINKTDIAETEAQIATYATNNQAVISRNAALDTQERRSVQSREEAKKENSALLREAAIREEQEERRDREAGRREIIDKIAHANGDVEKIARETQKVVLKKSTARRTAAEKARQEQQGLDQRKGGLANEGSAGVGTTGLSFQIAGLKAVEVVEPEKPYDPFGGLNIRTEYYDLQDHYEHSWLDDARSRAEISAGGYSVPEYCARAMLDAHAGLGCFIATEMADRVAAA